MKIESRALPDLTQAASAFAALGSEQRLSVLRTLVRAGPEGLSIGELGARTGVTGSTLTHHVKILTAASLVTQAAKGGPSFAPLWPLIRCKACPLFY